MANIIFSLLQPASIKGTVYDQNTKEPLIGAGVSIEKKSWGTASDIDGAFLLEDIQFCSTCAYTIKATYIGYKTLTKDINLFEDKDVILDLFLEPQSVDVEETTVTAERRQMKVTDSPAAIEIISAGDIKREESTNLGSYLDGIKGVDFSSSGINNYSISVRGFNSSFTSRLLTLTDGRIANIPALRVVNYSTIPQSSKDIDNIEVVLGPSTALYGANAHSGVVNITSKSPADSEGFDLSVTSSIRDNHDLSKLDTRWATKLTKALSMKVSASYLKAYDWEFVSEQEYKVHTYPYTGIPGRMSDGKDNNPWVDDFGSLTYGLTADNRTVRIGNGENNWADCGLDGICPGDCGSDGLCFGDDGYIEPDDNEWIEADIGEGNGLWDSNESDNSNTGDPDNDGVEGEDWYNGYDDDGDGLIDEDYFIADGIDNDGDCLNNPDLPNGGDTNYDGCICCGWNDQNGNGVWDPNESNNGDAGVDEGIDTKEDQWFDGIDNDGNGKIDDGQEQFTGAQAFANWQVNLENDVIIFEGRKMKNLGSEEIDYDCGTDGICADPPGNTSDSNWDSDGSEANGIWDGPNETFIDTNGDGEWTEGSYNYWYLDQDLNEDGLINEEDYPEDNLDVRGTHYYNEDLVKLMFDVFLYDYGEDNIPGDHTFNINGNVFGFIDGSGNADIFDGLHEGDNTLITGFCPPSYTDEECIEKEFTTLHNIFTEPCFNGTGVDHCTENSTFAPFHDCGLDGLCEGDTGWPGADYGEGNGTWDNFDWNNDGTHDLGEEWDPNSWTNWNDLNNNNLIDLNEVWSDDNQNGIFGDDGDTFLINSENDINWEDTYPYANSQYSPDDYGDQLLNCGQDGLCPGDEYWEDTNEDGIYGNQGDEFVQYSGLDFGEADEYTLPTDENELDQVFDTGDGCFGCEEESFIDINEDGYYTPASPGPDGDWNTSDDIIKEPFIDTNGDGTWTPKDYEDNLDRTDDVNGDGMSDYPDFEVLNAKADIRIDYDPTKDFNFTFATGYSWSKTNQVTGTGRYLADGYQYTYYLLRSRFKNLSGTFYINEGNSGNTRGYNQGNRIKDESKNMSLGMQHWFWGPSKKYPESTKIIYGFDYFKTIANSNGTILNDGPNGYDNDGDSWPSSANDLDDDNDSNDYFDLNGNGFADVGDFNPLVLGDDGVWGKNPDTGINDDDYSYSTGVNPDGIVFSDQKDNDLDGLTDEMIDEKFCYDPNNPNVEHIDFADDFYKSGFRDGKVWECSEGVDEDDEFIDVTSQEMGAYFQTISNPRGNKKWELITALRIDKHDKLEEKPGIQPKFGLTYKPNDFHEYTFSYGKAFNTPSAITLYTDLFITRVGPFSYYSRGNKDGTPYVRVGDDLIGDLEISKPQVAINGVNYPLLRIFDGYWEGNEDIAPYIDRVQGAPYFLAFDSEFLSVTDYIPLDTAIYTIYVPELNDTGRVYTPIEAINVPDVEPIKTEKIQTIELGFQGFLTEKIFGSLNYYQSQYEDFFSGPTIITPFIVERDFTNERKITTAEFAINHIVGMLPANSLDTTLSNPPFGTQWNGLDDDNDWSVNAIDVHGNPTEEIIGVIFPYFTNNASQESGNKCEPYDTDCFEIQNLYDTDASTENYANIHFNLDTDSDGVNDAFDWSQTSGFGWQNGDPNDPQWGYVDYITCGTVEDGYPWHGDNINCNGADGISGENPDTGVNDDFLNYRIDPFDDDGLPDYAEYGDTIGITIFQPEDVVNNTYAAELGNITFGESYVQKAQFWHAVGIDEYDVVSRLSEAERKKSKIVGANGEYLQGPGTAFTPLHAILAPLNYGSTKMSGVDVGMTYFLPQYNITFDTNFSFYTSTEYYNKLTKKNDPINAPKFKMNASLMWKTSKFGTVGIKYKHVDQYLWKDGIWSGIIGPYDLVDLMYNYEINDYLGLNVTIQNLFNDIHKEMVGGPFMTRQITMRLSASI